MGESGRPILAIAEVFPPRLGGSGRWLWELYRRLPSGSVHVAAGSVEGDAEFDRQHSLPVERLPLRFSNWGLLHLDSSREYRRAAARLGEIARKVRPAVVHCAKAVPEGALAWWVSRRLGVPFWCFVHGEELMLARTSRELRWMTARVLAGAERIVANSHHTSGILQRVWGVDSQRIVVLHPGVDTSRFVPAEKDPAVRSQLGWTNRRVLLTVGALQQRKGQDMMLRVLPRLRERFPDVLYCVAGEGWETDLLKTLARDLQVDGLVQFRGVARDDELLACYQQCDVFALPNRQVGWDFEGFGIVLLEAQACGRPVVTGTSGGTVEAVDVGRSGLAIDCSSPDALGEVLATLLSDPVGANTMGTHGRRWCCDRFDWGVAAHDASAVFFDDVGSADRHRRPA